MRRSGGSFHALNELLGELLATGGISAASARIEIAGEKVAGAAVGSLTTSGTSMAGVTEGTWFDLASLTKPLIGTVALLLDSAGSFALSTSIGDLWPQADLRLARRSLEDLLRHAGGLSPWAPLYALVPSPAEVASLLLSGEHSTTETEVYSDLGFVLWGLAAERHLGLPLHEIVIQELGRLLSEGLALEAGPARFGEVAGCALDTLREVELAAGQGLTLRPLGPPAVGWPQDGNARFLGGSAGHAGLFAPVSTLCLLGARWLHPGGLLTAELVDRALVGRGRYALGWWRRDAVSPWAVPLSGNAFGIVGFVGGSWWLDPQHDCVAVLLAHRRDHRFDMNPWRARFHALAASL